jgi:competence protein ComEC
LATLLPLPERSLGQGILLGKNFSQSELLTSFRKAGLSHIVVLSGYNVVIIVRGFLSLAPFFGRRKVILFSVVGILVFLFSIGPEPPLLRAVIMTLTLVLGEVVGRPGIGSRPFYFTLFVLLLCNPLLLSSNVSFQLSFLATAGILYLEPLIKQYSNKKEGFVLSLASTTFAAELAVLPLIIVTFSTFSPYFLLANILVLPVIPIVMLLGVLAVLLSFISFFLASVVAWPLYGLLKYVLFVAHGVSRLPGASLSLPDIPIISLVFFYILFFYFLIYQDEFSKNPFIAP